jgi:hypothetical protein
MSTTVITHEVDDVKHWLSSPKRAEAFGALGYTVRTFVDPTEDNRVGLVVDGPDGLDGIMRIVESEAGQQAMKYDGVRPETIRTYVEPATT